MEELTHQEKALTMFKEGLIMQHDFENIERVEARWIIHNTVRQLTKEEILANRAAVLIL